LHQKLKCLLHYDIICDNFTWREFKRVLGDFVLLCYVVCFVWVSKSFVKTSIYPLQKTPTFSASLLYIRFFGPCHKGGAAHSQLLGDFGGCDISFLPTTSPYSSPPGYSPWVHTQKKKRRGRRSFIVRFVFAFYCEVLTMSS